MTLEDCLPADLRGEATTIARVSRGFSGAGVYRVDAGSSAYVLKVSSAGEPLADWHRRLDVQRSAANAGLAPRIVHVDDARRAVLSEFVIDRSFPALYGNPQTRQRAIGQLGATLRRVQELPVPERMEAARPRRSLTWTLSTLDAAKFPIPRFVREAVRRVLDEELPPEGDGPVLSHNDVNPSNLVHDGERVMLLDWDMAAPNDRWYDLATVALFFRMDSTACEQLLAAYGEATGPMLPARFVYDRRLVAVFAGLTFLDLARQLGHPGAVSAEAEPMLSLSECYAGMRAGTFDIAGATGQWSFGLALIREESGTASAQA